MVNLRSTVENYDNTRAAILNTIENNKSTLNVPDITVQEAGAVVDFNIPAPFIYVHFDLGASKAQQGYMAELIIEFFVGHEAESSAEAKSYALNIAVELMKLLRNLLPGIQFPQNDFVEFFAEFANRSIVKLTGITRIKLF